MFFFGWFIIMIATCVVAAQKNRNIAGWALLSLISGPLALILVLLSPKIEDHQERMDYQYSETSLSSEFSLSSIKAEFESLKGEFTRLSNKLNNLGTKISDLEAKGVVQPVPESQIPVEEPVPIPTQDLQEPQPVIAATRELKEQPVSKGDIETNLGKFWLNKIGIVIFSLGVAFLLSYTFTRIGPVAKILLGYLVATALFIAGMKMEKMKKFVNYGRVLLGGAWAIIYFTTYAMYHFEASKIINSQLLDLFFLAVVAFGIIAFSLRYKSEALTAIALFIGYFTSVLGDVGYFTVISAGLLALVALVMVYKMQWIRFIFLGIILTYLTHFSWVIKQISFSRVPVGNLNVENVYFLLDAGFLAIYWSLFIAAVHLIKNNVAQLSYKKLAAANFTNFILFFFMTYPKFHFFYPAYKFNVILGFGLGYMALAAMMELSKKNDLFISDIIIAVFLLTLSVPLKFMPYHTTVIWLIELPFLLLVGFIFQRRIYRYLGFALSFILLMKIVLMDWQLSDNLRIFSFTTSWPVFLSFLGFVSTAICFGLYRFYQAKNEGLDFKQYFNLKNFYSGFSVIYLTLYMWKAVKPPWLTLGFSLESLVILVLGALLLEKYIRWYALAILVLAGMRFCFFDRYHRVSEWQQLLLVYGPIVCAFAEYVIYRKLNRKSLLLEPEVWLTKLLFFAAASLLIFAIVVYVQQIWITLSIAIVAILALLWGAKSSDKYIRIYALLVLLLVAFRFSFIDSYYGLSKLFQWSLICAKLACAYAVYFIYRALDKKSRIVETEKRLISPLFYASSFLVVLAIFNYIKDIWISIALGLVGVSLFVSGFLIKEKVFRHGGFIIFGLTLARVVFVDLAGLAIIYKIISFIILGILFLGVSFIYTKYTIEKPKEGDR